MQDGRHDTKKGVLHFRTPPRVRVRATVKLSAAFFHDESSITIGGGGVGKCNSAPRSTLFFMFFSQNTLIFVVDKIPYSQGI